MNTILSNSPTNIPSNQESLSHFFNVNSGSEFKQNGGEFKVYGDAVHVTLPYSSTDSSYQWDIRNGLLLADAVVDYSEYDTRDNSISDLSDGSDGIVDKIIVVLRGKYLGGAQGWNVLTYSGSTLNLDGVTLSGSGPGGSGVSVAWPDNYNKYQLLGLIVHEIGHHILSITHPHANGYVSNNYKKWSLLYQSLEKKDGFSVNAFESWILGWSSPTIITSDEQIDLDDFLTSGESVLYKLPGKDYEFYGIENRQKLNMYDDATVNSNDKGIFITHYNIEGYYNSTYLVGYSPAIRVYTSDGRYDWDYYQDVPSHWNPNQYIPAFGKVVSEPIDGADVLSMHFKPSNSSWNHLYAIKPPDSPVTGADYFKGEDVTISYNENTKPLFSSITNPAPSDWAGTPTDFAVKVNDQSGSTIDIDVFTNYDPYDIKENTTWDGQIFLDETANVDNNSTLTILPGTTVYLADNVSLIIRPGAKLIAEGTQSEPIEFVRMDSGQDWYSVNLMSSSGNSIDWTLFDGGYINLSIASKNNTISHSTFRNATYRTLQGWHNQDGSGNAGATISYSLIENSATVGFVAQYIDLDMSYNTIKDNTQAGLYITAGTVFPFHDNLITNYGGSYRHGIEVTSSGSLNMLNSGFNNGHNEVTYNADDQISTYGSLMVGTPFIPPTGENAIFGNYYAGKDLIANSNGGSVSAQGTWWGQSYVVPDMFSGSVHSTNNLSSNPVSNPGNNGSSPNKVQNSNEQSTSKEDFVNAFEAMKATLSDAKTIQEIREKLQYLYTMSSFQKAKHLGTGSRLLYGQPLKGKLHPIKIKK